MMLLTFPCRRLIYYLEKTFSYRYLIVSITDELFNRNIQAQYQKNIFSTPVKPLLGMLNSGGFFFSDQMMLDKLPVVKDDGLITPEVGPWAEYKYRLVWNYAKVFSSSMKLKWDALVYIDLFAGAGHSKIKGTSRIIPSSPLLALDLPNRFNKYIYCDIDGEKLEALKKRINQKYSSLDISYVEDDVNENIHNIFSHIPIHNRDFKVLSFCFVDPYKMKNLHFQTIRKLSKYFVDFLILIPSYMDAHRNPSYYLKDSSTRIEDFTGNKAWRDEWKTAEKKSWKFGSFIVNLYGKEMQKIGYNYSGLSDTVQIRYLTNNIPLYHLAFFSRNQDIAYKLWKETQTYSNDQLDLL